MYGTVARFQFKPHAEAVRLMALSREFEALSVPGHLGAYVYRTDADPTTYLMAVAFADKAAYHANAVSPEQDTRYQRMCTLFTADPEWQDGEIIFDGLTRATANGHASGRCNHPRRRTEGAAR